MNDFIEKWHTARKEKGSNIVAGLDPAIHNMSRGEKGLSDGADVLSWSKLFIEAVAPCVAALKPNQAYFQGVGQHKILKEIVDYAHAHNLLVISDNKIADIGSTNGAWVYYNAELGFDALTAAPYAGNIEGTIASIHEHSMGAVTMGLMSNPEYKTEMNFVDPESGTSLWKARVERALAAGVDAIVVGGTYTTDDEAFMEFVDITKDSDVLYLIPGIGAQGGTVESFLASGIPKEKCMINSGRAVMFPAGSASGPEEQREAAKVLRDSFNNVTT